MTAELDVRRYRSGDGARVRELQEAALRDADAFFGGEPDEGDLQSIASEYLDPGGEFLVGLLDDRIVAMGGFRPPGDVVSSLLDSLDETTVELKRMHVDPDHQRRGYGDRLLTELERRALDRGYAGFVLTTTDRQVAAKRFYEANGFERVARERVEAFAEPFDLLVYRASITDEE